MKLESFFKKCLTDEEYKEVIKEENIVHFQNMYTEEFMDAVICYTRGDKRFLILPDDLSKVSNTIEGALDKLADVKGLMNPILLTVAEDGVILVD